MKTMILGTVAAVALVGAGGCSFIKGLASLGSEDEMVFTVDMEAFDVKSIQLTRVDEGGPLCIGGTASVKITAEAFDKTTRKDVKLETSGKKVTSKDHDKMDPTEFAMQARDGTIENGTFTASSDPFAGLLGYDVKATYRMDKSKEATVHFEPSYACIGAIGSAGESGSRGMRGERGAQNGGAGGPGGPGGPGGAGPSLTAYVSIVETPLFDRVGVVKVSGGAETMTLFDLATGITVVASGGAGGRGGSGGDGGPGPKPRGSGGQGGIGGDGGPGGDGGQLVLIVDERFPELRSAVKIDVGGGPGGGGGSSGQGGMGSPSYRECSNCALTPAGPRGPSGSPGQSNPTSGRPGASETREEDVSAVFSSLPAGVRLRTDARAEKEAEPSPPPPSKGKKN